MVLNRIELSDLVGPFDCPSIAHRYALGYLAEALDTATEYFDDRIKGVGGRQDQETGHGGGGAGRSGLVGS